MSSSIHTVGKFYKSKRTIHSQNDAGDRAASRLVIRSRFYLLSSLDTN